ncbi:MAG: repeat protein [Bryobacterales bacterium]|nr:repeat protein [Bryobacterales bacterium]
MSYQIPSFFKIPSVMLESGLSVIQTAAETAQMTIAKVTGQKNSGDCHPAPVAGPADVDTALSDLAARAMRIMTTMPLDLTQIPKVSSDMVDAARRAFEFVDLKSPSAMVLPAQLALSATSLMAQSSLRGLVAYGVLGPERVQLLMKDFITLFSELPVYLGLEYSEKIEQYKARLEVAPEDHKSRMELGDAYIKCGLYEQAEAQLTLIPKSSSYYADATHDATVALYRAGQPERAARIAVASLAARPGFARTRFWLMLAAKKLGAYPNWVPAECRMEIKSGYAKPSLVFEDIAAKIGLDKTSAGRGVAVFDSNNDGYLDVLITAAHGGCNFYRNNGDGTFTDASVESGLDKCVNGFGITIGDYNNDGYPDVFVTRLGFYGGESQLFRNNGDGTFTDVTAHAGLNVWGPAFTASFVDYDNDGRLDLFIANNLGGLFERKTPNRLFHNNGDGTFTEVGKKAGIDTPWPSNSGAWGDYNNDGFPDLFVSNGMGRSQLYKNNGDGTFTDVSREAGVEALCFGSPSFWWDFDNDGWLDLAQFAWSDHDDVIHTLEHGDGPADGNPMRIYRNNRDGTFTEVGREHGLSGCWGTMSGNAGDFNNDGYMDVVLGNGSPKMDRLEPLGVLEYDGETKQFKNITFSAGFPLIGKSHGVTMADLFGDGRLSVIVGAGGAYPADLLTMNVFCPTKLPGNYINVRLVGMKSNKSAIGARITLRAGGKLQMKEVSGGTSFGCLPFEQHFGLAKLESIDTIDVRWPSGLVQRFENPPVNSTIEMVEGQEGWADVYARARARIKPNEVLAAAPA